MRMRTIFIALAAIALAGCGESRLPSAIPGAGTGSSGPFGGSGGTQCTSDTTAYACIGKTSPNTAELSPDVFVSSPSTTVHVAIPVEWQEAADERAQGFEVWLSGNGQDFFFHPNGLCPVVPDRPGVNAIQVVDLGTLTGMPRGHYTMWVRHGLLDPCYVPPSNADTSQPNWTVLERGTVTVCN